MLCELVWLSVGDLVIDVGIVVWFVLIDLFLELCNCIVCFEIEG